MDTHINARKILVRHLTYRPRPKRCEWRVYQYGAHYVGPCTRMIDDHVHGVGLCWQHSRMAKKMIKEAGRENGDYSESIGVMLPEPEGDDES